MSRAERWWRAPLAVASAAVLVGCPPVVSDPPPPPIKSEIVSAPPKARGALAAGTDAAPQPEVTPGGVPALPAVPLPGAVPAPGTAPSPGADPAPTEADAGLPL
ncbi:MAG TPA: hypothetical protein VIW29_04390 [Polyangiaceae bacterium]